MAITLVLLVGLVVPVVMAVACVVIARHRFPPGQRVWAGLAGAVGAIGLPMAVIVAIRAAPSHFYDRLPGEIGPLVSLVLFSASALVAPAVLLWIHSKNRKQR
jgi:hypothetical protein